MKHIILFAITLSFLACKSPEPKRPEPPMAMATPAPTPMLTGEAITSKSEKVALLKGKPILLDYFLTSCDHCKQHSPHVGKLIRKYADKLTSFSFAVDNAPENILSTYVSTYGVQGNVGLLSQNLNPTLPRPQTVPQISLYDSTGNHIRTFIGWDENVAKSLEEAVRKMVK